MSNQLNLPIEPSTDPADAARDAEREQYLARLREYLKDPKFRAIEGFPIGEDEDILALSDPPYYTACPNPFLPEIIQQWRQERDEIREELGLPTGADEEYRREPYASDLSEGKNDPLYRLPSYHTKVPIAAVRSLIEHYTDPGDIVLDGFCGTGMAGIAASIAQGVRVQGESLGRQCSGARHAVLVDLSPFATFTASVMNSPMLGPLAQGEDGPLATWVQQHLASAYETEWNGKRTSFDYAVWTEWGRCSVCLAEFPMYDAIVDYEHSTIRRAFHCPSCLAELDSGNTTRVLETAYDPWIAKVVAFEKTSLVMLSRRVKGRAVRKQATSGDAQLAVSFALRSLPRIPMELPYSHMTHERNNLPEYWGITHIHHFYSPRNYWVLSQLSSTVPSGLRRSALFALVTVLDNNATRRNRFYVDKRRPRGSPIGPLSNTLYVPSLQVETNICSQVMSVLRQTSQLSSEWPKAKAAISTQSSTQLHQIPDDSIDFVFTDPPFGGNINYSEQNLLHEWWLRVCTNRAPEAIANSVQQKGLPEYQQLMRAVFCEYYRVLKPGRWLVVEFHNSSSAVWTAIQTAIQSAGFVVSGVRVLDKMQSTLHQDLRSSAVDKDLLITALRPALSFERSFEPARGTPEGAWRFVRFYLANVPMPDAATGSILVVSERSERLLYDRMVAYHLTRNATVPLSASQFYAGLRERFVLRDGMFFLPGQVVEYDRARMSGAKVQQLSLFVNDEKSAIQWLRRRLDPDTEGTPQTYQDIQPAFLQELHQANHEALPELRDLLEQNFVLDERGRYHVPDAAKAGDIEQLRKRALLREFDEYAAGKGRLRQFRSEAVREGFAACHAAREWQKLIHVAERLPSTVLEEDPDLLMYYDSASLMVD